jgi:LPS O-antigen subunit length determinant protein (WzzB/FepE family)
MSGLITIGYKHVSPIFSTEFTRKIINEMNNMEKELDIIQAQSSIEYLLQTVPNITVQELKNATTSLMESQLKMKMLASSQKDYLFKSIDGPHIPDSRHAPSRALICISVTLLSMMMAILYLLFFKSLQQYISRLVKA